MKDIFESKTETFFADYPIRNYEKGQVLIYAGNDPEGVFYLESGMVRQYDITDQGEEVVVNVFKDPSYFPLDWAINKSPNQYYYQTSTEAEVRVVPKDAVVSFLKNNPDVTYDLLGRLFLGTNGMQRRMAHMMGGSGLSRVLFELVIECKRFGELQKDGTYFLAVHEDELARRTGLSRETINREIGKLKRSNMIAVTHKVIIIYDLELLEKKLGSHL